MMFFQAVCSAVLVTVAPDTESTLLDEISIPLFTPSSPLLNESMARPPTVFVSSFPSAAKDRIFPFSTFAVIVTSPPNPLELAVNSSADPVFDPHPCSMLSPKAIAILNVTSFFITLL